MRSKKTVRKAALLMALLLMFSAVPFPAYTVQASSVSGDVTTWRADDIIAATTPDKGLSVNDTWTANGDSHTFEDGTSISSNARASSTKANNNGSQCKGTVPNAGSFIKYEAEADGTLTFYEKTGGGKTFYIVSSDNEVVGSINNPSSGSTYDMVSASVTAGKTYYAYMAGGTAQVWQVTFKADGEISDWDSVAAPVIDSVTLDSSGNFVVNFTAKMDKAEGFETVQILMLQDGYPVSEQTIKTKISSVTFMPLSNGNFTFRIIGQRTGCADKEGEAYVYENYVLAVKKPVLELVQNRGNGSLYLDWLNIEDADSFMVDYKLSSADTYTNAVKDLKAGDYLLTGLAVGSSYDVKISAVRSSDGFVAVYEKKGIEVTQNAEQKWYVATVGSAQTSDVTVNNGSSAQRITLPSSGSKNKEANTVPNTNGYLEIAGCTSGKISDGEEGFTYYYTMIDPDTQNFHIKAVFEITDTSLTPDNQTGFGLIATDMLGNNYWGTTDVANKYFNSASVQFYSSKGNFLGMRNITGYFSIDTSSFTDVERNTYQMRFNDNKGEFVVGNKYVFELNKTDDGFEAICNGEKLTSNDPSIISVQEDGSICVGIMAARKVSVKVSEIEFSTSASAGVGSGIEKDDRITPALINYSSGTVGAAEYEYIIQSTAAGKLTITAPDGAVTNKTVAADEVVKLMFPVAMGENVIKAVLEPDASQNLTSASKIDRTSTVIRMCYGEPGETIVVTPNGTADGDGTMDKPLDIHTAVKYAQPGQIIYLANGTYNSGNVRIERSVCGTEEKPITMVAESVGGVIFEGIGLNLIGSYWHIYGIYVHKPGSVGIQVCGNYNTVEMCTVEGSANTGVQVSSSGSADVTAGKKYLLWPSYNLIKNCESFDNCDAGMNDADGFAAKLTCGEGNKFYGCISHNNIDDGWDLFAKTISGEIGKVTIENCVAYNNGWLSYAPNKKGEGNGFKLGGANMKGGHVLINCVSFDNGARGVTSNSCPDCKVYRVTSFNNGTFGSGENISLYTMQSNVKAWDVGGLLSISNNRKSTVDNIPYSLAAPDNYLFNGANAYNNQGAQATTAWFVSTDTSVLPTRNADGTINMHGLLELTADAPAETGARLVTSGVEAVSIKPQTTNMVGTDKPVTPSPSVPEGAYDGAVMTELLQFAYDEETHYLSGQIVVVEWVDTDGDGERESTVPEKAPVMTFASASGGSIDVFVTPTGTNTYYFDRLLGDGLPEGEEYAFYVTSGDERNISEYRTTPVYTGNSGIGTQGKLGRIGTQDLCFRTSMDGILTLYGAIADDSYEGAVNSVLLNVESVKSVNGNFVSGQIIITEWVDGVSIVPKTTPVMSFESVDGQDVIDVFMASVNGTNTYYFDRNLSEEVDVTKEYIFRITLTEPDNVSPLKSMVATTNYMDAKEGVLWETDTQEIRYKTTWAGNDNQLRIYAVNK